MWKTCDSVLTEPLNIFFTNCMDREISPDK